MANRDVGRYSSQRTKNVRPNGMLHLQAETLLVVYEIINQHYKESPFLRRSKNMPICATESWRRAGLRLTDFEGLYA